MASADVKGNKTSTGTKAVRRAVGMVEPVEARRLMAYAVSGAPGVLLATNASSVDSAAAAPDTGNNIRYATVLDNANSLTVVPVTGPDSSAPGAPIAITKPAGSIISNVDVAANTGNNQFVVTYELTQTVNNPGGGQTQDSDIYAAVFANGTIVGAPIRVNATTGGNQTNSRVAMDGGGNFVVVWESTIAGAKTVGRRFTSTGAPAAGEFLINATAVEPNVAANASGQFVIAYASPSGTFVQLYATNGSASGSPISLTTANFTEPAVGIANNGRFIVAWTAASGAGHTTIVGQRFSVNGTSLGTFNASVNTAVSQNFADVAVDTAGGFAVGWAQINAGVNYDSAAFRVFNANGVAVGNDTVISGVQFGPDFRFGLAYRIPNVLHVAYATPAGEALMQTYVNSGGGGGEAPVPSGALLIDLTAQTPGVILNVQQDSSHILVTINGVLTSHNLSSFSSIYVRGTSGDDFLRLYESVTLPAIIYGRAGGDTIYGGSNDDQIDGGDGGTLTTTDPNTGFPITTEIGNIIQARGGNDYVYGGSSNDTLFGGAGNDRLLAGPGINVTYGEDGDDTLIGGTRGDGMFGGTGNDSLDGGDGGDNLDGGAGNDTLTAGDGNDQLFGSNGDDSLEGGLGDDILHGGRGDDRLFGNEGRDSLFGDANADYLRGGGTGGFNGGGNGVPDRLDIYYYDGLDTLSGDATRIQVP